MVADNGSSSEETDEGVWEDRQEGTVGASSWNEPEYRVEISEGGEAAVGMEWYVSRCEQEGGCRECPL